MGILDDLSKLTDEILGDKVAMALPGSPFSMNKVNIQRSEREAVLRWQKTKNQQDFDYLWGSLKPVVMNIVNKYSLGSTVPQAAFKGETMKLFVKALETYDPNRGAGLATHITHALKKLYRFNLHNQNVARIMSEGIAGKINTFTNRKVFLEERLGRPATAVELADDLGWPLKEVERVERDNRPDVMITGKHFGSWLADQGPSSLFMDKLNTLYLFETNSKEKLVMEYTYGLGGKPSIKSNIEIAKKIGITPNRVSQIKAKLAKKLSPGTSNKLGTGIAGTGGTSFGTPTS